MFGVTFAILVAPNSVLVLCYGLIGSSGNSLVTGAFLTIATVAAGLLCFRRDIVLLPADYLFCALVFCILSSSAIQRVDQHAKEYELLVVSLAAYPACRLISRADIVAGRSAFIWTTGIIVALGSVATAVALWQQWDDQHGKPFVFGFDAAGTYFLGSLCFLRHRAGDFRRADLAANRARLLADLLAHGDLCRLPGALHFIALAGALGLAAILSEAKHRKHVVALPS